MTIEKTNEVDAIGIDKETNKLIMTMTDHLDWNEENHLLLVQEKINAYLSFIESGEIYRSYPQAKNLKIIIRLIHRHPLNSDARNFFSQVNALITNAGFEFQLELFNED